MKRSVFVTALLASTAALAQNYGNIPPQTIIGNPNTTQGPANPFPISRLNIPSGASAPAVNMARNPDFRFDATNGGQSVDISNVANSVCGGLYIAPDAWWFTYQNNGTWTGTATSHSGNNILDSTSISTASLNPGDAIYYPGSAQQIRHVTGNIVNGSNAITNLSINTSQLQAGQGIFFVGQPPPTSPNPYPSVASITGPNAITVNGPVTGASANGIEIDFGPAYIQTIVSASAITVMGTTGTGGTGPFTVQPPCGQGTTTGLPTLKIQQTREFDVDGIPYGARLQVVTHGAYNAPQGYLGFGQTLPILDVASTLREGTPEAKTVTAGINVKPSPQGGNIGFSLQSQNGLRQYFQMFAVTPNQWNKIFMTVPGDTKISPTLCPGTTAVSVGSTWPQMPIDSYNAYYPGYVLMALSFALGSQFLGTPGVWHCYAGGDSTQSNFMNMGDGQTIDVAQGFFVTGSTAPPFSRDNWAAELQHVQSFVESTYPPVGMWPDGQLYPPGHPWGIGAVSRPGNVYTVNHSDYGGNNVTFQTTKRCAGSGPDGEKLYLTVYSGCTGATGMACDLSSNTDIPVTVQNPSYRGFDWYVHPTTAGISDVSFAYLARCGDG